MQGVKKHRKLVHGVAVFITTAYLLMVSGLAGGELLRALNVEAGGIEYAIYFAVLPVLLFWVVVLRLTHLSQEDRDIEDFKRRYRK